MFLNVEIKLPDDDTDEPKHVAHCCTALKCYVWRYTAFVFQLQ